MCILSNIISHSACLACRLLKVPSKNEAVGKALSPEADPEAPITTLTLNGPVGEQLIIALCAVLLGRGAKMRPAMYKHLRNIALWNAGAGEAGCAAIADLIKFGKAAMPVESVSLIGSGCGPLACRALSEAIMLGASTTCHTIVLDMSGPGLGDEGVKELAVGAATSRSLKKLSLAYCGLTSLSAEALVPVIRSPLCALEILDVSGNTGMGAASLHALAQAAQGSVALKELSMRDCGIGSLTSGKPSSALLGSSTGQQAGMEGDGEENAVPQPSDSMEDGEEQADASGAAQPTAQLATGLHLTPFDATCAALSALGEALSLPAERCGLCRANLDCNPLSTAEAQVLLPYLGPENKKCEAFRVDVSVRPPTLFASLFRQAVAKKKGKGKAAAKK